MRKLTLSAIALAASTLISSGPSHAGWMGSVWTNQIAASQNATIANMPAIAPTATFTVNSLNFGVTDSMSNSVGTFLTSGGAGCVGAACALGATLNNSYFLFTSLGQEDAPASAGLPAIPGVVGTSAAILAGQVGIRHDDGVQLERGTTIVSGFTATGTSPILELSAAGAWATPATAILSYGESFAGPAVLQSNLRDVPTPEPASLALIGSALVGFGVMRRRRKTV